MTTNLKTKLLRIALFALRELGHKDGKASASVLELLEKEHIKYEQRWIHSPDGRAWQLSRK